MANSYLCQMSVVPPISCLFDFETEVDLRRKYIIHIRGRLTLVSPLYTRPKICLT